MKSTIGVNLTNISSTAFTRADAKSQKHKNSVKSSESFGTFGICAFKSFELNVDEIDTCSQTDTFLGWGTHRNKTDSPVTKV